MGSMDAPGYNAGRRRVTADPPIAPGRACYKPRRVRAGSSPLVIAHMAVESARLVPGMKSLQLCQLQASENGPDTTERAPLDARGWVPSVFRARPAIKMQECLLSLFRARTGRRRRRGSTRREVACAQRVYATNSLPRKSKKPSRGAPPACGPAAATQWTPGKGRGRRKRVPPAKTGSDEPRCT